ncbi:MAG: T9SS type A sorting domain-containing protein [Flavobacteriales bacterium]|nr:T9SS type A sorting domain-containing protein [Flavobacteriales bacterium]NNK80898.1 T9SS type A sorting domain-containing protein [Flavobacteriales bacterium]
MKILIQLLFLIGFVSAYAQPTIVSSSVPTPGTIWTEVYIDEPTGVSPGSGGANQIWNLSNASGFVESDVLEFVTPSSLPSDFDGLFPDADLALYLEDDDSTATFFTSDANGFYIDGVASNSVWAEPPFNMIDYIPNNLFIPFNYTYLDVRENASRTIFTIDQGVPFQYRTTLFSELSADGYGTVITPAGTFSNALRMEISSYTIDSVFADTDMNGEFEFVSTDGPTDEEVSYFFLQNSDPYLIATMDLDEDMISIDYFSYFVSGASGIGEQEDELGLQVFPNPSQGDFSIRLESLGETYLRVLDLDGKELYNERFISTGSTQAISLDEVATGTYIVEVRNSEGTSTSRLKIE